MKGLDIFGDGRKIPHLLINVKVKTKEEYQQNNVIWNSVFGYIMKKPRTKLEFLFINNFRTLPLNNLKLNQIKEYISEEDYKQLSKVEEIFNQGITTDVKAFILAILKVPYDKLKEIATI